MNKGFVLVPILMIVLLFVVIGVVFSSKGIFSQNKMNTPIVITEVKDNPPDSQKNVNQEDVPVQVGKYSLPSGIYGVQIEKTYQFEGTDYALVLRPSMNVNLRSIPNDTEITFVGVLTANKDNSTWEKSWVIQDGNATQKNNPYHMWSSDEQLILAVVNQNGAGSGDGLMTLVDMHSSPNPKVVGCYYFSGYGQPSTHGDYFEYTKLLDKHELRDIAECENWKLKRFQ